jgi:uncharacterized protein (DUF2236 family)
MSSLPAIERHRAETGDRLRRSGITRPGPGSVSWKVNREIIVVIAWGRAILLQLGHPLVGAGVHDHSRFRGSLTASVARFRSTVGAMLALTFGNDQEAIAAAARINAIHDRVSGRLHAAAGDFAAGERYSAHDAELLRWVHATLLDSILLVYERLVGPLTAEERDRYCAESAVMEPLLNIPAGLLPRNRAALEAYMRDMLIGRSIAVTDSSRVLARAVLFPPWWRLCWPAFRPVQLITVGLLPPAIRHAYGFAWTRCDAHAMARWITALHWVRRLMPSILREWPLAHFAGRRRDHQPRTGSLDAAGRLPSPGGKRTHRRLANEVPGRPRGVY